MCGPGRPGGETLDPPWRRAQRHLSDCRVFQGKFKFGDATATKLLMHLLFSSCTNWPRLEKGKGKQRAAGVPAASVASAVDLEGKEGSAPPAKRSNSTLLEEAVYAMDALAGDPRANAHYMELHKEEVARRGTSRVSAQEYSCAMCAWIGFVKKSCTMIYALVTCAPCQAP
jgi:hypothetical protein